jgi:hypothetical protein
MLGLDLQPNIISHAKEQQMTSRFESFGQTPRGQELTHIIDTPDRYVEFRAFSREGFPAVTALVSQLRPILEPLRTSGPAEFDSAKQFVGYFVALIMRRHGHSIIKKSTRVPGKLFTVAALWSPEPTLSTGEDGF